MHQAKFTRELRRLNPAQRQAVETIEGPVMVIAGPGTGKTQVVAMRIAQILTKTQLRARNVLALTFTEAGVTALKTRLFELTGPEAYQVTIDTFHGFANEVLGQFSYVFNLNASPNPLSDLERYQLLEGLVTDNHRLKELRPLRRPAYYLNDIASAIKTCKQEAISPTDLSRLARKEYKAKLNQARTAAQRQAATKAWAKLEEFVGVYQSYEAKLAENQLYDYEDMILRVVEALNNNAEVKAYYQERYQYVLVDEYQDTNNAQNLLIETLIDFFESPNVFVVGDDKQAIYRFQGASVANMLHFTKRYRQLALISLEENYRNPPKILKAALRAINYNTQQLSKYLKNAPSKLKAVKKSPQQPTLVTLSTNEAQFFWIGQKIKGLLKQCPADEIAVLFRTNNEADEFRHFAEKMNLPVAGVETANLINEPEIRQLIIVLEALNEPKDAATVLAALPIIEPELNFATFYELNSAWRAANSRNIASFLEKTTIAGAKQAWSQLTQWRSQLGRVPITLLIEQVLDYYNQRFPGSLARLERLNALLGLAGGFAIRRPDDTLAQFLSELALYRQHRLTIPLRRLIPEVTGVRISTVHGVKGLEFSIVFLANVDELSWRERPNRRLIPLPRTMVDLDRWQEDPSEDERRLFFVALTRAKSELYLTYAHTQTDGRAVMPSQFVSEIAGSLKTLEVTLSSDEAKDALLTVLRPVAEPTTRLQELSFIRERIRGQPLSYTHLRSYLLCPRQYLLRQVIGLPQSPTPALVYGQAVHRALEAFFKEFRSTKRLPSQATLLANFKEALSRAPLLAENPLIATRGEEVLAAFYNARSSSWPVPLSVEYNFWSHQVTLDGIWLTGKYDRLELIDPVAGTVRVVDYKTVSQARTRGQIEGTTQDSQGEIKQQLTFYAMLAKLDRHFPYQVAELAVTFVDDKKTFREESFKISSDEIDSLAKLIKQTWSEINQTESFAHNRSSFDEGCELCGLL